MALASLGQTVTGDPSIQTRRPAADTRAGGAIRGTSQMCASEENAEGRGYVALRVVSVVCGLALSIGVLSGCWVFEQLPDLFDGSGGEQPPAGQELPADRLPAATLVTTRVINEAEVPADVRVVYLIEGETVHHATSLLGGAPDATSSSDVGPDEADTVVVDGEFLFDDEPDEVRVGQAAQPFGPLVFVSGADFREGDVLEVRLRLDGAERNRPPTAFDVEVSAEPEGPTQITLQASDPDGDPLTFSIVDEPLLGSLTDHEDGDDAVTYWPPGDYLGPDSFTFQADDGQSQSNVATVSIMVGEPPVNEPPFISLSHPDGPLFVQVDRVVVVRWVDDDDLGSAQINVWYSDSSELGGGTQEGLINPSPIDQASGPDRVDFDVSGLSMGSLWYVHAVIDDGVNPPVISTGGPITLTFYPYGQMQLTEGRWYEWELHRVLGDQDGGAIGSLAAGDVNDDLDDDLVIGASQYGDHGRVFVLFGGGWVYDPNDAYAPIWTDQIVPPLGDYVEIYQDPNSPDPNAGRIGHDVACGYLFDYLQPPGERMEPADTQGGADVLVGSPQGRVVDDQGAGEAVLQFSWPIAFGPSPVDYADLYSNSVGYALPADPMYPARDIGWSVAIGDITYGGDRPLIGAPGYGRGYVFAVMEPLVEPPFFSPLDTGAAVFYLDPNGPSDFAQLGWALAGGGDLDANEGPDVAMGAPTADLGGGPDAGSVWVVAAEWEYYDMGGQFVLPQGPNMPESPEMWRVDGAEAGDQFGSSIVFGDLDGNFYVDDLIVGAPGWADGTGKVYAIVGDDPYDPNDPNAPGLADQRTAVNAGDIASMGMGWEFRGAPGDQAGTAVAITDFDTDYDSDIAIGAPGADGGAGAIYVIYARTLASLPRVVDLADIGGSLPGLKIGGQPGERLGSDLTGLDWHSRGRVRDLAVAAPGADTDGAGGGSNQGAVYLFGLRPAG